MDYPVRLLICGYGLAALTAIAVAMAFGGLFAPLLTFWLGGAGFVLALPFVPVVRRAFRRAPADDIAESGNVVLEEELRRWEEDREADSRAAREAIEAEARARGVTA